MLEEENENIKPLEKMREESKDLVTLYLRNLNRMLGEGDAKKLYGYILYSIRIGKTMLPQEYTELKKKANDLLSDKKTYPGNRDIKLIDGDYVLSSDEGSGSLRLKGDNPEVFKGGNDDVITQQMTKIIPQLEPIEGEIRETLIEAKVIEIKRRTLDDFIDGMIKESFTKLA